MSISDAEFLEGSRVVMDGGRAWFERCSENRYVGFYEPTGISRRDHDRRFADAVAALRLGWEEPHKKYSWWRRLITAIAYACGRVKLETAASISEPLDRWVRYSSFGKRME